MRARIFISFTTVVTVLGFTIACSSGPKAPEKGTPAFYWDAANSTFKAGDYQKTLDHLDRLLRIKTENEYAAKARPWFLVLSSGMTRGYMELADDFEIGAKINKANPAAFRRKVSDYRRFARELTLPFLEHFEEFEKTTAAEVPLAFPFPSGTVAEPVTAGRVAGGIIPPDAELETAQTAMLQRGVLLSTARATGSGDDTSKAQSMFNAGEVKVPRPEFMLAMATNLHDNAMLFDQKKMDEPERMKLMLTHAAEALKAAPQNKAVKDLSTKIETAQKKLKKT